MFRRLPWACIRSIYRAQRMTALVLAIPYGDRPELAVLRRSHHILLRLNIPADRMIYDGAELNADDLCCPSGIDDHFF